MMSDPEGNENQPYDKVVEKIEPLAVAITNLRAQMKTMGLFPNERELLHCPMCGLEEDVTVEGLLFTSPLNSTGVDTGLRFHPLDGRDDWWRCPGCGTEVRGEGL